MSSNLTLSASNNISKTEHRDFAIGGEVKDEKFTPEAKRRVNLTLSASSSGFIEHQREAHTGMGAWIAGIRPTQIDPSIEMNNPSTPSYVNMSFGMKTTTHNTGIFTIIINIGSYCPGTRNSFLNVGNSIIRRQTYTSALVYH